MTCKGKGLLHSKLSIVNNVTDDDTNGEVEGRKVDKMGEMEGLGRCEVDFSYESCTNLGSPSIRRFKASRIRGVEESS